MTKKQSNPAPPKSKDRPVPPRPPPPPPPAQETALTQRKDIFDLMYDADAFEQSKKIARVISESDLIPKRFIGKPGDVWIILQNAARMQADPFMMMECSYVVHGRPGMEAKLATALVNKHRIFDDLITHRYEGEGKSLKCWALATRNGKELEGPEASMEIAEKYGWTRNKDGSMKTIYEFQPRLKLAYNANMNLIRVYCPEVLGGMLTVEELRDMTPKQMKEHDEADPMQAIEDAQAREKKNADKSSTGEVVDAEFTEEGEPGEAQAGMFDAPDTSDEPITEEQQSGLNNFMVDNKLTDEGIHKALTSFQCKSISDLKQGDLDEFRAALLK